MGEGVFVPQELVKAEKREKQAMKGIDRAKQIGVLEKWFRY